MIPLQFLFGTASLMWALIIIWCVVAVVMGVWVYRDAEDRGENGVLWLIVVLLLGVVGLIIYLVMRK